MNAHAATARGGTTTEPAPAPAQSGLRAAVCNRAGPPAVIQLTGSSMAPSLERGWRIRIAPLEEAPRPGDVLLLSLPSGLILHRLVHRERGRLFHRGDAGGRVGVAAASAGVGRAVAILDPPGLPFPSRQQLHPRQRRQLDRLRLRCRLYTCCRGLLGRTGLERWLPRRLTAWLRRLLLGAPELIHRVAGPAPDRGLVGGGAGSDPGRDGGRAAR